MTFSYKFPRAALTVDCVVLGYDEGELKVLLIERALEPFKGKWQVGIAQHNCSASTPTNTQSSKERDCCLSCESVNQ